MATTENTGMTHHAVHVVVNVQRVTTRQESVLVKILQVIVEYWMSLKRR